jgi:hypothetical protein
MNEIGGKFMRAYLLDEGVLLTKEDKDFNAYNTVYDKKYGYYDEGQCYIKSKEEAISEAKKYVEDGVENTYAVVSNTTLDDDVDLDDCPVDWYEEYILDNVVYSVAKINGKIIENFLDS